MFMIITLAIIGLLLIYLEFFVPGGVAAFIGSFFLITSVVWFAFLTVNLKYSLSYLFVIICIAIAVCRLALWHIRSSAKYNSLYSDEDQEGYIATSFNQELVGKTGICASNLKPSGSIFIEGMQEQAMAETGFIEKGTEVKVIGGQGSHLIVKPL